MPRTGSRMSASSSTIRMSVAMLPSRFFCLDRGIIRLRGITADGDEKANAGAASRRCIEQFETAAVIFQNFRDDRQTEAGPFGACRHIRLEQALPALLRQ